MSNPAHLAYFITGHGFGHGVRSCALINALPPAVQVTVFSSLPGTFFREELAHPCEVVPAELDCGCVQKDVLHADRLATLGRYQAIEAKRDELIPEYAGELRKRGVTQVLADIPPLAFPIAREAGVPAAGIGNFNWVDIYSEYLEDHPQFRPLVDAMAADYALADTYLSMYPGMAGLGFARRRDIGMVVRSGRERRVEIAARYGLDPGKKWCLVYIGSFGLDGMAWKNLAAVPGWEFFGLYSYPGTPPNYHTIDKDPSIGYSDLTASCDCIFGKLGYGLVSECIHHGIPVLFFPRFDFSEYAILREALFNRRLGIELSLEGAVALDLGAGLEKAITMGGNQGLPATGMDAVRNFLGF